MTAVLARSSWAAALAAIPIGIALGYLVAVGHGVVGIAAVGLPALAFLLARQQENALIVGVLLMLSIPYWIGLGAEQATVARVAAVTALGTVILCSRKVQLNRVDAAVAVLVAAAVVAWQLGSHEPGSEKILLNFLLPVTFYLAARTIPLPKRDRVLWAILIGGAIGAATVIYEWLVHDPVFIDPDRYLWNTTSTTIFRPGGIFGSPPGAAAVLAMAVLAGLPLARRSRANLRLAVIAVLALMTIAVTLTFTRAGIVGLVAGSALYLWMTGSRLFRPVPLVCSMLALTAVVFVAVPHVEQSPLFQQGIVRPGNFEQRQSFWELAIPITTGDAKSFVFGKGTGVTLAARAGGSTPADIATSPVLVELGTHNQYVLHLLEQGILGLGALLFWLGISIHMGLGVSRRLDDNAAAGATAALIAFSITLTLGNGLLHAPTFGLAALLSGLVATSTSARRAETPA